MNDHSESSTLSYKTELEESEESFTESYSVSNSENTVKDFKTRKILTRKKTTSIQEGNCSSILAFCALFAAGFAICYFFITRLSMCNPDFCADPGPKEVVTALDAYGEERLKEEICSVTGNEGSIPAEHLIKGYSQVNPQKTIEPVNSTEYNVDDTGIYQGRSSS